MKYSRRPMQASLWIVGTRQKSEKCEINQKKNGKIEDDKQLHKRLSLELEGDSLSDKAIRIRSLKIDVPNTNLLVEAQMDALRLMNNQQEFGRPMGVFNPMGVFQNDSKGGLPMSVADRALPETPVSKALFESPSQMIFNKKYESPLKGVARLDSNANPDCMNWLLTPPAENRGYEQCGGMSFALNGLSSPNGQPYERNDREFDHKESIEIPQDHQNINNQELNSVSLEDESKHQGLTMPDMVQVPFGKTKDLSVSAFQNTRSTMPVEASRICDSIEPIRDTESMKQLSDKNSRTGAVSKQLDDFDHFGPRRGKPIPSNLRRLIAKKLDPEKAKQLEELLCQNIVVRFKPT